MDKSSKRGKIPQSDWPLIMARYEAGETLSSIARTYDCSPPAISYIVSRSKTKQTSDSSAQPAAETQLVKTAGNGSVADDSAPVEPMPTAPVGTAAIRRDPPAEPRSVMANGSAPANGAPTIGGEPRRTLHLSLGGNGGGNGHAPTNNNEHPPANGNGHAAPGANGNGHGGEPQRPNFMVPRPQSTGGDERMAAPSFQAPPPRNPPPFDIGRAERSPYGPSENRPAAQQPRDAEMMRKNGGNFIDQELRSRVDGDIAAFLAAFDAALAADTHESRFGLREATDRLLRAGARTRIELERLEARVPLSPREGGAAPDPVAWRQR